MAWQRASYPAFMRIATLCAVCIAAAVLGVAAASVVGSVQDAHAQNVLPDDIRQAEPTGPSILNPLVSAGHLAASDDTTLSSAHDVDIFETGGKTYAAVTFSGTDSGLQIIDITNPNELESVGHLRDNRTLLLDEAQGVDIFAKEQRIYAAVASFEDDGLQIIEITNPASPVAAGQLRDTEVENGLLLEGASDVDTFAKEQSIYAVVASQYDNGLQIVDITDPANPAAVGHAEDQGDRLLDGVTEVEVFTTNQKTYAAVTSIDDDGLQIVDLEYPNEPVDRGHLGDDDGSLLLGNARGVSIFAIGDKTYAAVVSNGEGGLQIIDITSARNLVPAGQLADDDSTALGGAYGVDTFKIRDKTLCCGD